MLYFDKKTFLSIKISPSGRSRIDKMDKGKKSKATCNLIELAVKSVLLDKSQTKELNSHGHQFLPVL